MNTFLFDDFTTSRIRIGMITGFEGGKRNELSTKETNPNQTLTRKTIIATDEKNGIFLLKFENKHTYPVLMVDYGKNPTETKQKIFVEKILPLYTEYANKAIELGADPKEFIDYDSSKVTANSDRAVITSLVMRALTEEIKLGNTFENGFTVEDSRIVNQNMITLMKRATPVLEQQDPGIDELIKKRLLKHNLVSTKKGSPFYFDEKENMLYQKVVFIDTKNIKEDQKNYLVNKLGIHRWDGATITLAGAEVLNQIIYGTVNKGVRKNIYQHGNLFVKHAEHNIGHNNVIANWMKNKGIGAFIIDINEKHGMVQPQGTEGAEWESNTLFSDNPITYYIPYSDIHRIGEKFNTTKTTRGANRFSIQGFTKYNSGLAKDQADIDFMVNIANKIVEN